MKILLLYASFGDGHLQAANAIAEVFETAYNAEVVQIDSFRQTNGKFARVNEWLYETLTRFAPFIYGWSYDWTRRLSIRHPLWRTLALFSRRAAWRALLLHQPDIVVQFFPDHALARLPQSLGDRPLMVTVLTDYAVHSRWFHPNVDVYALPSTETLQQAQTFAFLHPSTAVTVAGIPIRSQFSFCQREQPLLRPTIVVSAGGRGLFPQLAEVLTCLLKHFPKHDVTVFCGRNVGMEKRVCAIGERLQETSRLRAKGYTADVSKWIQQADFVVAKAGGISTAECLTSGTPLLFYKPQPGQERGNAEMIERMGAGRIAQNLQMLSAVLNDFQGTHLQTMRQACLQNGFPESAKKMVHEMVTQWQERGKGKRGEG